MSNESIDSYGGKVAGGKFGGNFDKMIGEMLNKQKLTLEKHKKFDPKKTDSSFLQQTDKFWNPADLPE